jgi:hypothetical protein
VIITGIGAGLIVISSLGAGGGVSRGVRIGGDGSMIEVSALLAVVLSSCWVEDERLFSCGGSGGFGILGVILLKPWYVRMLRVLATD